VRALIALAAGGLLLAAAPPAKVKPAPADDKPAQPGGAAARQKHGPEPLARPADDIGMAEDPAPPANGTAPTPQPKP
jgi:hypothetical protein